jgi:dihydropyrimidinase
LLELHYSRAAIAGGTTTIIDFVMPYKGESLVDAVKRYHEKADGKACCDFAFHVAISWFSESIKNDMKVLANEYGINSFKVYMAYKGLLMLSDTEMFNVFETCKEIGAIAMVHAENGSIIEMNTQNLLKNGITGPEGHQLSRPEEVEAEAVHRACMIAHQVKCPLYVVHVMSKSAAKEIQQAREKYGDKMIFGETLSSALATDGSNCYHKCFMHAAGHVMSPPLRPDPTTPQYLMKALRE